MKTRLALISVIFLFSNQSSAQAHGDITFSSPKPNSILNLAPKLIEIKFDGKLIVVAKKQSNFLELKGPDGKLLVISNAQVIGSQISSKITSHLKDGKYRVNWRVVSEDGHPVQGFYFFTVKTKTKS